MPGEKSDAEIKRYLVRLAEGDRAAMGDLVFGLKPPAERGIRAGFAFCHRVDHNRRPIDPAGIGDKVFVEFLKKLETEKYQDSLARADSPTGHANVTARRMTIDELTTELGEGMVSSLSEEKVANVAATIEARTPPSSQDEQGNELRAFFDELPIDDVILLEVLLVEHRDLPPSHIEKIANDRGVAPEQVQKELEARAGVQGSKRQKLLDDISDRQARIVGLTREIASVELTIAEVDRAPDEPRGRPVETDLELSAERTKQLGRSSTAVRNASPEERSAYLKSRYALQETYARKQLEVRKKLGKEYAAGPRYEEVVQILGLADPSDAKAMKTAKDTLTTRANRLLKRFRKTKERRRG